MKVISFNLFFFPDGWKHFYFLLRQGFSGWSSHVLPAFSWVPGTCPGWTLPSPSVMKQPPVSLTREDPDLPQRHQTSPAGAPLQSGRASQILPTVEQPLTQLAVQLCG